MSVQTSCEHCGFNYVAKPDMAGKKVRCRNCGLIFTVTLTNSGESAPGTDAPPSPTTAQPTGPTDQPDLGLPSLEDLPNVPASASPYERNSDATRVMPAIRTAESNMTGGVGSAKSMMDRTGDPGTFDIAGNPVPEGFRPTKPFDFPFAPELDKFGPKVVLWLLLLWVTYIAYAWKPAIEENQAYPVWAGFVPAAIMLVFFAALWLPLFAFSLRRVSTALKFQLPFEHKTRAASLAALPFALGAVFWLTGWSVGTLVTGVILGIAIGTPAAWFLYRLQEKEIPYAAIALTTAGTISTILSIALYLGANLLLNQTLIASGQGKLFPVSPMGPNLTWPGAEKPQAVVTPTPTTPKPPVANPNTPPEIAPQTALRDIKGFTFDRSVDQVLFAPGGNITVAVVSSATGGTPGQEVVRYQLSPTGNPGNAKGVNWTKVLPFDTVPAPFSEGDACLSPDAARMARLVQAMDGVTVHVWSFNKNEIISRYGPLDWQAGDKIQMLSFNGDSRVICVRRQKSLFQVQTVDPDHRITENWYVPPASVDQPNKMKDTHGQMVALSPDNTKLAVIAVDRDGKSWLRVYGSNLPPAVDAVDHELTSKVKAAALDPTGLAFSPDGSRVAVAYEEPGSTSIWTCEPTVPQRAELMAKIPGGIGIVSGKRPDDDKPLPNSLVWLAGGDHWLYGKQIADGPTAQFVGTIELGQPIRQQTVLDGRRLMALISTNSGGSALVQATIAVAAPATQP